MTTVAENPFTETQDDEYRAFLAQGEVRLQKCASCGHVRPPTSWCCPACLGETWEWIRLSGKGVVETFVWYLRTLDQRFREIPYNVALVQLEGGARVMGNVNGVALGDLYIGQTVEADICIGFQGRLALDFRPADQVESELARFSQGARHVRCPPTAAE